MELEMVSQIRCILLVYDWRPVMRCDRKPALNAVYMPIAYPEHSHPSLARDVHVKPSCGSFLVFQMLFFVSRFFFISSHASSSSSSSEAFPEFLTALIVAGALFGATVVSGGFERPEVAGMLSDTGI